MYNIKLNIFLLYFICKYFSLLINLDILWPKNLRVIFFLISQRLKEGDIVFYGKNGWTSEFDEAIKIPRNKIEFYEGKCRIYEDNCIIISPTFIEIDENGDILNLRDKLELTE